MKTKILTIVMLISMMLSCVTYTHADGDEYIDCSAQIENCILRQNASHATAEHFRAIGDVTNPTVALMRNVYAAAHSELLGWQKLSKYTYRELDYATLMIYYEAKYCGDDHQQYVGAVLVNRLHDSRFDDTIKECLEANGQYSKLYTSDKEVARIKKLDPAEWERCQMNAIYALREMTDMPHDVVYQSNYKSLGTGVWKTIHVDTGYFSSNTYFNYG